MLRGSIGVLALLLLAGCGSSGGVGGMDCGDSGVCPSGGAAGVTGFGGAGAFGGAGGFGGAGAFGGAAGAGDTGGSGGGAGAAGAGGATGGSGGTSGAGGSGGVGGSTGGSGGTSGAGGSGGGGVACTPSQVVVSEVYGGGGAATGSSFMYDYVVLHNRGTTAVSLDGWSLQYAAATGVTWQVAPIGGSIAPGGYFLVQLGAAGATGATLPTPDASAGVNLAQSSGKVALVKSTSALSAGCPIPSSDVSDFVGYGTADCSEGTAAAPAPSKTTSVSRGSACADSDVNANDFAAITPQPKNSAAAPVSCGCG